jgi:hypothetical protein
MFKAVGGGVAAGSDTVFTVVVITLAVLGAAAWLFQRWWDRNR